MKKYTRPEIEVTAYEVENVVTTDVSALFSADGATGTTKVDQVKTVNYTDIFGA